MDDAILRLLKIFPYLAFTRDPRAVVRATPAFKFHDFGPRGSTPGLQFVIGGDWAEDVDLPKLVVK